MSKYNIPMSIECFVYLQSIAPELIKKLEQDIQTLKNDDTFATVRLCKKLKKEITEILEVPF